MSHIEGKSAFLALSVSGASGAVVSAQLTAWFCFSQPVKMFLNAQLRLQALLLLSMWTNFHILLYTVACIQHQERRRQIWLSLPQRMSARSGSSDEFDRQPVDFRAR